MIVILNKSRIKKKNVNYLHLHIYFIYECLPMDRLFNPNGMLSIRVLPSLWNTYKGTYEISNFDRRRPHGGPNSQPFDPKLNATQPRIQPVSQTTVTRDRIFKFLSVMHALSFLNDEESSTGYYHGSVYPKELELKSEHLMLHF